MKIDNLVGLDQWKQAKEISIHGLNLASGVDNFSHLERFIIELKQISGEELVKWRETIIHRPSFVKQFTIHYRHFKEPGPFTSTLVDPEVTRYLGAGPRYTAWYNVPNNNENALQIIWLLEHKFITFECEKRAFANGAIFN
ncbi:unnamed protein product [Caenorhabditis brenneri]